MAGGDGLFNDLPEGRFLRDSRLGRVLHRGTVSYREARATDSLHLVVKGDQVLAHLDRIAPLALDHRGRRWRYAPVRVLAHNLAALAGEVGELLTGRPHARHQLTCERVWVDGDDLQGHGDGDDEGEERLPFNIADEAVHLLDSDYEPWSIHLELRLTGRVDEARLRRAVSTALARHPMARARKAPWRWRDHQYCWDVAAAPDVDPVRVVECPDDRALAQARADLQSLSVPLTEAPPLRLRLARHPDGDVVMLNANHAATDGFGALRFLRSVARAYAGDHDAVPRLDLVAARNLTVGLAAPDLATSLRRRAALLEKLRDVVVAPARLAPVGADDRPGYGFHLRSLSRAETDALVELRHPGTVNDLLLAALNLAIASWNADHGAGCGRVSVLVPANLRPGAWREEVVGNFTLMARVSTGRRHRRSPGRALAAITAQTRRKKRTGMGTALVELLGASPLLPVWAKQGLSRLITLTGNRLVDTAILSNLGRVDEPLDFGPDGGHSTDVHFTAPGRMPCGLSVGAVTAGGRLHLAFRYRHALFGEDEARRFADRFVAELERVLAAAAIR
ncbi:MAG TPA: hypothetical protein VG078_00820 [Acidimicrobiales bacterium]|nr:hypothetical protein [Acidimicrobiales bacterium]